MSCYFMTCVMLSYITCYITYVMLCYITYNMSCYVMTSKLYFISMCHVMLYKT